MVQQPQTEVLDAPRGTHFLVVAKRVAHSACRLERRTRRDRRRVVQLVNLLTGPGHILSPWGSVVLHLGQGHDAQTFMSQELSESSLPPEQAVRIVYHGPSVIIVVNPSGHGITFMRSHMMSAQRG